MQNTAWEIKENKKRREKQEDFTPVFLSDIHFSAADFYCRISRGTNFKRRSGGSWSAKSDKDDRLTGAVQVSARQRPSSGSHFLFYLSFLLLNSGVVNVHAVLLHLLVVNLKSVHAGGGLRNSPRSK